MSRFFFFVYRYALVPFVVVCLPSAALFERKLREGLRLRRQRAEPLPGGLDPVWIHAASGEFEYAKAVIREIKTRNPSLPVVVTYFSPSFAKAVMGFPGVDRAVALPLDLRGPCQSFLKQMHPRLLLVSRTDLWPEMLEQCRQKKIPVVIFSYTQKTFRSFLKRAFTRWTLQWVDRIYCVSESDRHQLATLNLSQPIEVVGDTRYDQVAYRLTHPKPLAPALKPGPETPCFVAGSTWPEDEAVLLPALAPHLLAKKLKLILVPHEPTPEHLRALASQLAKLGLTHALFSGGRWQDEHVLLVDRVGVLAELYLWGQFAFIGGSFKKSVHSVMEALGAGCVTFVGPHYENNREAVQFHALHIASLRGVEVVRSAGELSERVGLLLNDPQAAIQFSTGLQEEFARRLGASRKLVDALDTAGILPSL